MNKIDFNELFSQGWEKYSAQIGSAILWSFVYCVGQIILSVLSLIVVGLIYMPVWTAGYAEVMKKLFNGEDVEFNDFFTHMNKLGSLWMLFLAIIVCSVVLGLAVLIAMLLPIFWVIIGPAILCAEVLIGCVAIIALMLIIDKGMDGISALKAAWARIKEELWMMLALFLIAGIVGSILAFVTAPLAMLVMWGAYYVLFPKNEISTPTPPLQ